MKVLVVNCGSSSLKYQLIDSKSESVLASGLCERIGIDGVLNHTPAGHDKIVMTDPLPDHQTAISFDNEINRKKRIDFANEYKNKI